jgi:APA family basic amino acid/polyamine antiporter
VDHRELQTPRFVRDLGIAVVGLVFSVLFIVYSRNTGEDTLWKQYLPFIFAGIAFLAGIPIYLKHRTSMATPPPVPEWRP